MKLLAIEYPSRGEMRLVPIDPPSRPGATEILLRTRYTGITNGTERHALLGEHGFDRYPGRHGYQHVAVVEAAGERVERFREGDTVFFGRYVGHRGWNIVDVAGGDPESNDSHLTTVLPPEVVPEECALLGVAGVAYRAVRRCGIGPEDRVWVIGGGLIGQFAARFAKAAGARVTMTEPNEFRQSAAGSSAHRVLNPTLKEERAALRDGGPYSCILDASGTGALFEEIARDGLLARGGTIAPIAVRQDVACRWGWMHSLEATIRVTCHFSLTDLHGIIGLLRRGAIGIDSLITHRAPIARAPEIYEILRDAPDRLLGVVFDWEEAA